ncbi:MAG: hypothetical protein U0414_02905 [Polyangiaceae bacterium]
MRRSPFAVFLASGALISACAAGTDPDGAGGGSSTASTGSLSSGTTTSASSGAGTSTSSSSTGAGTGGSGGSGSSSASSGTGGAPSDFLNPCTTDADCQSGVCIQIDDGTLACTIECGGGSPCPSTDFRCSGLTSDMDTIKYCLPRFDDVCKPCSSDDECKLQHNGAPVFDWAKCVEYANTSGANETVFGSFCTTECSDLTLPCPTGYSCQFVMGSPVKHCIKDDQTCACKGFWPDPSTTACSFTNISGTCTGSRDCSAGTLEACTAKTPAAETCNGVDDDCNGTTDDGGNSLCSNGGLGCVSALCQGAAGCKTQVNPGFCVIGGSVCVLAGSRNPANQCEVCDPAKTATDWSIGTGLSCDDGEPCTTGETCNAAAQCTGGGPTNCSAFGTPPCSTGVCQMGFGCVTMNNDGVACDDGQYCSVGEKCAGGLCGVGAGIGAARDCSAQGAPPCKTGVCNEALDACVAQINQGTTCNDNDPCSTASSCNAVGNCVATSLKDCSAQSDQCNVGVCNSTTGACQKAAANLGLSCNDMDACTGNGTCGSSGGVGVCSMGAPIGDSFEANNTVGTAKTVTTIDDCGNTTGSLTGTINGGTDVDFYKFTLNNSSSLCDYGTIVTLTPPSGRDYDLMVCVLQSGSFSASCANGSSAVAAPTGLSGYSCCQSTLGAGVADQVKINWGCSGTFCSDGTGTVYMRVTPKNGSQTAECTTGYSLSWVDD